MALDFITNESITGTSANAVFESASVAAGVGDQRSAVDESPVRLVVRDPSNLLRYRILKRSMDVSLVLLFSPVLIALLLITAAAVRISSPGPIFFSHRRIRSHGAFFTMWKFRTMCSNSAEVLESYLTANPDARLEWHLTHKLKDDPRVTPLGSFLRRASLDELPQFWNVVNGSMSLVGPRPIVAAEVEKYGSGFVSYCSLKPGITGLWQISGRSSTSYELRVTLDSKYAATWSLRGDLLILCKTLLSVANQDGAY